MYALQPQSWNYEWPSYTWSYTGIFFFISWSFHNVMVMLFFQIENPKTQLHILYVYAYNYVGIIR